MRPSFGAQFRLGEGAFLYLQRLPAMAEGGLVFQLVNVFENQLINGLTRAGSVNLKTDLRA